MSWLSRLKKERVLKMGTYVLQFSEDEAFYTNLDYCVERFETVVINVGDEEIKENSPLLSRIKSCKNFKSLSTQNLDINTDASIADSSRTPGTSSIAGETIIALAIIGSITIMYAIYKGCNISIERDENGKLKIVITQNKNTN